VRRAGRLQQTQRVIAAAGLQMNIKLMASSRCGVPVDGARPLCSHGLHSRLQVGDRCGVFYVNHHWIHTQRNMSHIHVRFEARKLCALTTR
jgi:hypothetical protein